MISAVRGDLILLSGQSRPADMRCDTMHELSTMVRLVSLALEAASREGGGHITSMEVSVGEMSGILEYYLRQYFPQAAKGTAAEGAELTVNMVPVKVCCLECGEVYEPRAETNRVCPNCSSPKGRVIAGRDVVLDRITVEDGGTRPSSSSS